MIIIGITGSIGMGKSTIASMLKFFGIPIHDSDLVVKGLIETNALVFKEIKKNWPEVIDIIDSKEIINKGKLSEIIFNNIKCKENLEKIIHPLVNKKRKMFLKKYEFKKNIVGMDVPLLYETGLNKICNYIFLALTSEENQAKRVLKRKKMTKEKFISIKENQWSDEMKKEQKPYIINTTYGKISVFILLTFLLSTILFKEKVLKK
ncbi:MAG: dephospho-CoA kinase [Alphaproteobacteria bacterium]|nr:dephospho-CoA kinase [Alphaproteobacteria bacterium]